MTPCVLCHIIRVLLMTKISRNCAFIRLYKVSTRRVEFGAELSSITCAAVLKYGVTHPKTRRIGPRPHITVGDGTSMSCPTVDKAEINHGDAVCGGRRLVGPTTRPKTLGRGTFFSTHLPSWSSSGPNVVLEQGNGLLCQHRDATGYASP